VIEVSDYGVMLTGSPPEAVQLATSNALTKQHLKHLEQTSILRQCPEKLAAQDR
jgi:hypothetical protein